MMIKKLFVMLMPLLLVACGAQASGVSSPNSFFPNNVAITGGNIAGTNISLVGGKTLTGGTISTSALTAVSMSGSVITNSTFTFGTINSAAVNGATLSGGSIFNATVNGATLTGGAINNAAVNGATLTGGSINNATSIGTNGFYSLTGKLLVSATAPTISGGFGTGASILPTNGTAAFLVNVGTGGAAFSGVLLMPAASNGWSCVVATPLNGGGFTQQTSSTTTSVAFANFLISLGTVVPWAANTVFSVNCVAY